MHCPDRSPEENELDDFLIVLIEKFEQEFYQPGSDSNPHSMLKFLIDQPGLRTSDLVPALGSESISAEILTGDLDLSIAQIKALGALFKVDPGVFI
ncbi:MAG: type II toxin-antitoxin system HigA family antitoxin [Nodosilinea sp.]